MHDDIRSAESSAPAPSLDEFLRDRYPEREERYDAARGLSYEIARRWRAEATAEKVCSSCGETKLLDDFHRDSSRPDGRRLVCRICRALGR